MTIAACCASGAARSGSVAIAAYCGSEAAAAPCEPSLAAVAVLPAARDALDERRLVGTAASDLSTMTAARGGHGGCHHANVKARKLNPSSYQRCDVWGSGRLPQGGAPPVVPPPASPLS
jgi:hypothetical protein